MRRRIHTGGKGTISLNLSGFTMKYLPVLGLVVSLLVASCQSGGIGPKTITPASFEYNKKIAEASRKQMLLNIVRLRYGDSAHFLNLGTVVSQFTLSTNIGAAGGNLTMSGSPGAQGTAGITYQDKPTITYTPLGQGEFAQRLLTPIAPDMFILLSHSGFSLSLLMQCCFERINSVHNVPITSWKSPYVRSEYAEFREISDLCRGLEAHGAIRHHTRKETGATTYTLYFDEAHFPQEKERIARAKSLLGLDVNTNDFPIVPPYRKRTSGDIQIETRSVFGTMTFLSHGVHGPVVAQGEEVSQRIEEMEKDYEATYGKLFRVLHSKKNPDGAYAKIKYRGLWYYIEEDDIRSKRALNLIIYLYALQSIPSDSGNLMLTLPTN